MQRHPQRSTRTETFFPATTLFRSPLRASVGNRADVANIYRQSRADVVRSPMSPDPRDPAERPLAHPAREIAIPDRRLGTEIILRQHTDTIKIKARDFRKYGDHRPITCPRPCFQSTYIGADNGRT